MTKLLGPICAAASMALLLNGCLGLSVGGGKKNTTENKSETYNVTLGQQLIDLQRAYEEGIITKKEYERQKKKLLRK